MKTEKRDDINYKELVCYDTINIVKSKKGERTLSTLPALK